MDLKQAALGIVILLVFEGFQAGYLNSLGTTAWVVGVIVFSVLLSLIGKTMAPKSTSGQMMLWNFAFGFALVSTIMIAYVGPYLPGVVLPPGGAAVLTPLVLSGWFIVFGAVMFATGLETKNNIVLSTGLIWLLTSIHLALNTGPDSYIHFGLIGGLPFVIYGLLKD